MPEHRLATMVFTTKRQYNHYRSPTWHKLCKQSFRAKQDKRDICSKNDVNWYKNYYSLDFFLMKISLKVTTKMSIFWTHTKK